MRHHALLALLAFIMAVGTAHAQAPDAEVERGGPARQPGRGARALLDLLAPADAQVEVTNVDHGVELKAIAEDPEAVTELQEQVEQAADDVVEIAGKLARWRERRPNAPMPPGLAGLLVDGEVDLSVVRIENGLVIQLLSDDQQRAEQLQENMAQWVEKASRHRERLTTRFRHAALMAELRRLMDEGTVEMAFEPTPEGMNVQFRTDDPALARKLQRVLPEYFQSLTEDAEPTPRPAREDRDRDPKHPHED